MYLEISNPMDYHVALYIRLSKEDETEGPSQSVTNQKSLLKEFVQQHHLSVYDIYVDDGWSGTNFERPDFQRMIKDIEAKKVNMVITKCGAYLLLRTKVNADGSRSLCSIDQPEQEIVADTVKEPSPAAQLFL